MTISDREPRVLAVLLAALHDRLNTIRAPRWQREGDRGFTDGTWRTCPKCRGDGQVRWKSRTVVCDRCNGRKGWRTDAYDEKSGPVLVDSRGASELGLSEFWTAAERLAQDEGAPGIERLERYIERRLARGLDGVLEEEASRRARSDHPSTIALWEGLSEMFAQGYDVHHGLLYRVYVWGWTPVGVLGGHDRELLDDALHILAAVLPRSFTAPRWAITAVEAEAKAAQARNGRPQLTPMQRSHRDTEIRRLAFQGRSQKQIAARVNCDQATVSRVLAKAKEAA